MKCESCGDDHPVPLYELITTNSAYGIIKKWQLNETIPGTDIRVTWVPGNQLQDADYE